MDFAAWFEAYVDGRWRTFDPRNNTPRIGRIVIGRGRDALDVAMVTTYGLVDLRSMVVWANEVNAPTLPRPRGKSRDPDDIATPPPRRRDSLPLSSPLRSPLRAPP